MSTYSFQCAIVFLLGSVMLSGCSTSYDDTSGLSPSGADRTASGPDSAASASESAKGEVPETPASSEPQRATPSTTVADTGNSPPAEDPITPSPSESSSSTPAPARPTAPEVALPSDYPDSLLYASGIPIECESVEGKSHLVMLTQDPPDNVIQHYQQSLAGEVWENPQVRQMKGFGRTTVFIRAFGKGQFCRVLASTVSRLDQVPAELTSGFGRTVVRIYLFSEPELPSDVPIPAEAQFAGWELGDRERNLKRSHYYVAGSRDQVSKYYQTELPKSGWSNIEVSELQRLYSIVAYQPSRQLVLDVRAGPEPMIGYQDGEVRIGVLLRPRR